MRVIRLYRNRRLYDSAEHTYITYEDIVTLLNKGVDFRIEDQRSKADCTHRVLVDVLVANVMRPRFDGGRMIATDETLRLLIRMPEIVAPALVAAFLDHTMGTWSSESPIAQEQIPEPARAGLA